MSFVCLPQAARESLLFEWQGISMRQPQEGVIRRAPRKKVCVCERLTIPSKPGASLPWHACVLIDKLLDMAKMGVCECLLSVGAVRRANVRWQVGEVVCLSQLGAGDGANGRRAGRLTSHSVASIVTMRGRER